MAFKMKVSPVKRGAIEGVGPNSPMQLGLLKNVPKIYNIAKNIFRGSSTTTKAVKSTVTGPNKIKKYMERITPRYHPQTGKLVNPPPYPPTNLKVAAEKLSKSAKYYGN